MSSSRKARFEYRIFAPDLASGAAALARSAERIRVQYFNDVYLVARRGDEVSIKRRGATIEVKRLKRREGKLELWEPQRPSRLPLDSQQLDPELSARLAISPGKECASLTWADLQAMAAGERNLTCVFVEKHRVKFDLPLGRAEFVRLRMDGVPQQSLAVEAKKKKVALRLARATGIDRHKNQSYAAYLHNRQFGAA
jgi:hypothetical protein